MVAEIYGSLTAFKAMFDMAKALKDINDATIRNAAIIELQEKILGAQIEQAALLERIGHLEKEMTRLEAWETEKQRYELKTIYPGAISRTMKNGMEHDEPPHWLCTKCYENREKSYLQYSGKTDQSGRLWAWMCPTCKAEVWVRYDVYPDKPFTHAS